MAHTLSVGSVVEREGTRLVVLGYNLVDAAGRVGLAYLMAPCPLGVVSNESLMLFDADEFGEPDQHGYEDELSRAFVEALDDLRGHATGVSFEEYRQTIAQMTHDMAEGEA